MSEEVEKRAVIDSFRGEFRFLSNFWPAEVRFEGETYASVEYAYQAAKCVDPAEREAIRTAKTPGRAKRLSRRIVVRADWSDVKLAVMRELVRLKFMTHADLAEKLVATGDAELVEGNNWGDTFWGVCEGRGENHLGRILMAVRDELNSRRSAPSVMPDRAVPASAREAVASPTQAP